MEDDDFQTMRANNRTPGSGGRRKRLSTICEEHTLQRTPPSRMAAGRSDSSGGESPEGDVCHLKQLAKNSAASVVSSGMDKTQSPNGFSPCETPRQATNGGVFKIPFPPSQRNGSKQKTPSGIMFSTPKREKEKSSANMSAIFGNISAIEPENSSMNSTSSSQVTTQQLNGLLQNLGPKATTSEVMSALEGLRQKKKGREGQRGHQTSLLRTSISDEKTTPFSSKDIKNNSTSNTFVSPLVTSVIRTNSCPSQSSNFSTPSSENKTFPLGDRNLGISNKFLAFGFVEKNSMTMRAVQIANTGSFSAQIRLSLEMNNNGYRVMDGLVRTLAPGERQSVRIEFRPISTICYRNSLLVESVSSGKKFKVILRGFGGTVNLQLLSSQNNIQETRFGHFNFCVNPEINFFSFRAKATGHREMFCRVVVLADDEVVDAVVRPSSRVVLYPGEELIFEVSVSALKSLFLEKQMVVLLLWEEELQRKRMIAYMQKTGKSPADPLVSSFFDEFLGEKPFEENHDYPVHGSDLRLFETGLNKTIIFLVPRSDLSFSVQPSTPTRKVNEQTLMVEDAEETLQIA